MCYLTYNDKLYPHVVVSQEVTQKIGALQEDCSSTLGSKTPWMFNRGRWYAGILELCGLHVARAMRANEGIGFVAETSPPPEYRNTAHTIAEEPPYHPNCKNSYVTPGQADTFEPPVEYTPGVEDNGEGLEDEGLIYYARECEYCHAGWYSPSCKHDYTQYPCPNCDKCPHPVSMGHAVQWVKGECDCEGVRGDELDGGDEGDGVL